MSFAIAHPSRDSGPGRTMVLWAAIASALATLPGTNFEVTWIALFAMPGLVALVLDSGPLRGRLGYAELIVVALLMEIALIVALFQFGRDPTPEAALTYTLLAPLAFLAARRRTLDNLHALFLSFCLVLIGVILRGHAPALQLACFVVSAALTLQAEARHAARAARSATRAAPARRSVRLGSTLGVTAACVLACLGLFELLRLVPSPNTRPSQARTNNQAGLSNDFDLTGKSGNPLQLVDDELVEVMAVSPRRLPAEVYLRTGYFDVAQVHRWRLSNPQLRRSVLGTWIPRELERGAPRRHLAIRRLGECKGRLFVPPGTALLRAANNQPRIEIASNTAMEFVRQRRPDGTIAYEVVYQDLRSLSEDRLALPQPAHLTALPARFLTDRYARLAREWTRGVDSQPEAIARALRARLFERCSYALREPTGEWDNAIDNFLFGDRHGYCMHFASALAILLRHNGIPCRIGVGLYGGTSGIVDGQVLSLGSKHAHAWVEIPLTGLGWVVSDPTPPAGLQSAVGRFPDNEFAESTLEDALLAESDSGSLTDDVMQLIGRLPLRHLWPWLALILLCALPLLLPRRTVRALSQAELPPSGRSARRLLGRILHSLGRSGLARPRGWSLERYASTLHDRLGDEPREAASIEQAFGAYQSVRFGGQPFDGARERVMLAGLRAAKRAGERSGTQK